MINTGVTTGVKKIINAVSSHEQSNEKKPKTSSVPRTNKRSTPDADSNKAPTKTITSFFKKVKREL